MAKLKRDQKGDQGEELDKILALLSGEVNLRSKRELIEKFIAENLPVIEDLDDIETVFDAFWTTEKRNAFDQLVQEENLSPERTEKLIENYLFAEREPLRDDVLELIEGAKPTIMQRRKLADRILEKIVGFVDTFIVGMVGG